MNHPKLVSERVLPHLLGEGGWEGSTCHTPYPFPRFCLWLNVFWLIGFFKLSLAAAWELLAA